MLDYFDIRHNKYDPKVLVRQWSYISNGIIDNTNQMIIKYRHKPKWLASNHILSQYLHHLDISFNSSTFESYEEIKDKCMYKATLFGITTSINTGVIHNGSFYGGDKEILIGVSGSHNPRVLESNWKDLEPVRVIRHGYGNTDYSPIDRKDSSTGNINVIIIDLPVLAFQYRCFRVDEKKRIENEDTDFRESMSKFLFKYPLANMLKSHIEASYINVVKYAAYDLDYSIRDTRDGQYLRDFDKPLLESLLKATDDVKKNNYDISRALGSLPSLYHESIKDYCSFPETDVSRQNSWALVYGYLPLLKLGLLLGGGKYRDSNKTDITHIRTMMKRLETDNVWNKGVMRFVKKQVMDEIKEFNDLL